MASQKARLPSQSGKTAHAAKVERFCPRLDVALASSRLTAVEMDRITKVENCNVDLDPRTPERSAWLAASLEELKSEDTESRFYALSRIEKVLRGIVMVESPEVSTGFSAYLLEHGILSNINLHLKAAETTGDFYLIAGILGDHKGRLLLRTPGPFHVISKVRVCCDLVQSLVTDARTARFIRRAIPKLTGILEGIYLAHDPVCMAHDRRGKCVDVGKQFFAIRELEKHSSLSALGNLTLWSTVQETALMATRKVYFRQVLMDAMNSSEFAHYIINRVITFAYQVILLPEFPPSLFEDFLRVAFNAMEISDSTKIVEMAFTLVCSLFSHDKVTVAQLTCNKSQTAFLVPLLAMAACPELHEQIRPAIHQLICMIDGRFRSIIASENATKEFQKVAVADLTVFARTKQLRKLYAASQKATFQSTESSEGPASLQKSSCSKRFFTTKDKAELFYYIPEEELEAQRRPCRKCSHSSCPNTESVSRQFKLCSNCRMAIYCSRECQKLAWKEGHHNRCGSGGGSGTVNGGKRGQGAAP